MTENNAAQPGQDPIYDAIFILTEEADSLSECHTRTPDDWTGEPEAKARYDHILAVVSGLSKLRAEGVQAGDAVADERAAFEYHARACELTRDEDAPDEYRNSHVQEYWSGWKARAALASAPVARMTFQDALNRLGFLEGAVDEQTYMEIARVVHEASASAPVAGEAQPVAWLHQCRKKPELATVTMNKREPALAAKGYRPIPLYAEPQASEAVREKDIMRFNIHGTLINPHPNGMYVRYEDHCAALSAQPGAQNNEA